MVTGWNETPKDGLILLMILFSWLAVMASGGAIKEAWHRAK